MANIPGISGYVQPGVFARDRVISQGVSIPGGTRIVCIIGEGLKERVLVASATGSGLDGDDDCSPTGEAGGRFFDIGATSLVSGRTEVYVNENLLFGTEDTIDENGFDGQFDFRIDLDTGCLELQGASIGDQDGKKYSASSLNAGNGVIVDGTCGDNDLISVLDDSAPAERWTVRCVGVIRDSNGDPVPGRATFTVSGEVSGQVRDEANQPIIFHSSYTTGTAGAVSGNDSECSDGFVVATSDDFGVGSPVDKSGDSTPDTTDQFSFSGDLVTQGQALSGDHLCIDGYTSIEIDSIEYDSDTDTTTLTLATDSLDTTADDVDWEIRATDLFIDDPSETHDGITGEPTSEGDFGGGDVGKVIMICSGDSAGTYEISAVTSTRRVRLQQLEDSTAAFPDGLIDENSDGLAETGLTWHLLETNGILLFGIQEGTVPFEVGDKFFIDVNSRVLDTGDELKVRYIDDIDVEDPEFFTSAAQLYDKHGSPSTTNTLSLGAQLAFENNAPGVYAVQAKPPISRRTSQTLLEEVDSNGDGGFTACGGNSDDCEVDDLLFIIPIPTSGLKSGRPDGDTQVNIFVIRDEEETQIFPNKVPFYNSQYENEVGQNAFISSSDTAFSYTIINTNFEITGQGFNGEISSAAGTFSTAEVDFDADDVGRVIVVQGLEDSSGTVYTTADDISTQLFGSTTPGAELVITAVTDDSTVTVVANDGSSTELTGDGFDVQFYIRDESNTTNVRAALLLHSDLVGSGTLQSGDGIRISYIDQNDADFFDTNWFNAFESLETIECDIVVPLPLQNRSGIFRAAVTHAENMSTIAIQKERYAFIGAQQGVTPEALLGLEEIAVEDIGVLEGVQGDDPEEVLEGNVEDLVNFKLSDNYTSERCMYFWPDQIVRNINGTNVFIDGFYLAACAGGWFSSTQNVALPLTNKVLQGFSILRDKQLKQATLNSLGGEGATILQPVIGGGRVLAGRTTSQSGFVEDEEISVMFIRDTVKETLRQGMQPFIGTVEDVNTQGVLTSRVVSLMSGLVSQGLVTNFTNVKVERDKVDPRQWNVFVRFQPAYPINYVFIDIEVGVTSFG
nr:hypothetical protein 94 [bacterium]